jgi:hypothetical protein
MATASAEELSGDPVAIAESNTKARNIRIYLILIITLNIRLTTYQDRSCIGFARRAIEDAFGGMSDSVRFGHIQPSTATARKKLILLLI